MKILFLVLLLFAKAYFIEANCAKSPSTILTSSGKVSKGHRAFGFQAKRGQFPYQARLQIKYKNGSPPGNCGGTLISSRFILTAGHCVSNALSINITLGDHTRGLREGSEESFKAYKAFAHPHYDGYYQNDIGLIKMNRAAPMTKYIQKACLPKANDRLGSKFVASGWGRTWAGQQTKTLISANLKKMNSRKKCQASFPNPRVRITNKMICTKGVTSQFGLCHGDSGGGLIDDSKNVKNAVVVGVTSFVKTYNGKHKCDTNQPQVFVNVAKYLPWIYDMMKRI